MHELEQIDSLDMRFKNLPVESPHINVDIQNDEYPLHNEDQTHSCKPFLASHSLDYTEEALYLLVGTPPVTNQWTLHITVIRLQFTPLLQKILPALISANVSFRIPKNKDTVKRLLDGSIGDTEIGKIICIYPPQNNKLVTLAKTLVSLTQEFRGPAIPLNFLLGGCVYTQMSEPILYPNNFSSGNSQKGNPLLKWPFDELTPLAKPPSKPLWNDKYKQLAIIKPDPKGRVIQANYFKSPFNIKLCIIKEGIKNMWADDLGRDIVDRINWQYELYKDLQGYVSTPKIFDYFQASGNVYLTMEFIKGDSLNEKIASIYKDKSWFELSTFEKLSLIEYFIKIVNQVSKLHAKGYIHRDITPANFIIDHKDNVYLIDMELAYSLKDNTPDPPFKLGTPGFMSPQQISRQHPTAAEDIYALGALMICTFCGISPSKIRAEQKDIFSNHLTYFTENLELIELITKCLSLLPEDRPTLSTLTDFLLNYKQQLQTDPISTNYAHTTERPSPEIVKTIIDKGIAALQSSSALSSDGLWLSYSENVLPSNIQSNERLPTPTLYAGIAGILFFMARASRLGYSINSKLYFKNLAYLDGQFINNPQKLEPGLLNGLAGIAVAKHQGVLAGLINSNNSAELDLYYPAIPSDQLDLEKGIAGQGLALLLCKTSIKSEVYEIRIEQIVRDLMLKQRKDGSWGIFRKTRRHNDTITGLANGTAGILCFLIKYCQQYKNEQALHCIQKGMRWLLKSATTVKNGYQWPVSIKSKYVDSISCAHGTPGIALTFIEAYKLTADPAYKIVAEKSLNLLHDRPMSIDYSQYSGLSGLGEVYMKASTVFDSLQWQERANWISQFFIHTFISEENKYGYWFLNSACDFDNALMTGISGILHFLMRTQNPTSINHISLG